MNQKYRPLYHSALVALATVLPFSVLPAQALPIKGTANGIFIDPLPTSAAISGIGTNDILFGDPFGTHPNHFRFDTVPFDTTTNTDFLIGTFTYFNGITLGGTTLTTVKLQVGLDFLTPAIGLQTSNLGLDVITTFNNGTADENADAVLLPSSFSSTIFSSGGTQYTLQLLVFNNVVGDGFLTSNNTRLNVREGSTAKAQLFGRITANQKSVPEPVSILALFSLVPAIRLRQQKGKLV